MWPNSALLDLLDIDLPIIQAPMAGANGSAMAVAVCEAGGLGSLPCAMLEVDRARAEIGVIRQRTNKPLNLNFLCHEPASPDPGKDQAWLEHLGGYYAELGLEADTTLTGASRLPFNESMCELVEEFKPEVVSFHFGLPESALLTRVKNAGSKVISSATTVEEARWLAAHGCDAIIAQGYEAGGHRGSFLTDDISTQPGTFALVPQVVDAVRLPVIAAGGIADGRGVAAAFALGAAGVQVGTAYLFTAESLITDLHRQALLSAHDDQTALTNVFSGKPARGVMNRLMREIGPMTEHAPAFPTAGHALAPLKKKAEEQGAADFSSLWSGQSAGLCHQTYGHETNSGELTRRLADDGRRLLRNLSAAID